jgi:hypothetical protein
VISDSGKKNKPVLFLNLVFLLILLFWLFELTKTVFHISFSVLPEMLAKPLIESDFMKITGVLGAGFALVLLMLTYWCFCLFAQPIFSFARHLFPGNCPFTAQLVFHRFCGFNLCNHSFFYSEGRNIHAKSL